MTLFDLLTRCRAVDWRLMAIAAQRQLRRPRTAFVMSTPRRAATTQPAQRPTRKAA